MILFTKIQDVLINYKRYNRPISEVCNDLQTKYNIRFCLRLAEDYHISLVSVNDNIENILKEWEELYHLHYKIHESLIIVEECESVWRSYKLNFFFEEQLPDYMKSFDINDKPVDQQKIYRIWDEVSNHLNKLTENNFIIDKYSGVISVRGDCKLHRLVEEYINYIIQNYLTQINIECNIIEVSYETKYNFQLLDLINGIPITNDSGLKYIMSAVSGVCQEFAAQNKTTISVNTSTTIGMPLLPQNPGHINVGKTQFVENTKTTIDYSDGRKKRPDILSSKEYTALNTGLSLTVIPLIVSQDLEQYILLKIRPSIHTVNNLVGKRDKSNIIVNTQDLISTVKVKNNESVIVGSFDVKKTVKTQIIRTNIPILSWFLNGTKDVNMTSYFIIVIKARIKT